MKNAFFKLYLYFEFICILVCFWFIKGEVVAIALAKTYNGFIASNNLRDISRYVEKYGLEHIAAGDILVAALSEGYIDVLKGDQIWKNMIVKRRMLPTVTFTEGKSLALIVIRLP